MIARKAKRDKLVSKYQTKREELKNVIKKSDNYEEIAEAQLKLEKLPLNSNPVRNNTRCVQCGRTHSVYRKFNLCRICLRQELMTGNVPGGRKSSW